MKNRMMVAVALGAMLAAVPALAQDKNVKIGVLNDQTSLYADIGGPNSVAAVKLAIEDSGLTKKGWKVDVVVADHQNKPDIGVNIARQWADVDKVDMITDTPNSGVALAVSNVVKEKNIVLVNSGAASADLTGKACSPNTLSATYDTYMLAHGTGQAMTKAGGDTWFFLTSDYAFGHALERDTAEVVKANGGKILGGVKHPLNTADFSSFLLQAQASKAKIVGLANGGGDTINTIKQAAEFGIVAGGQKLAGIVMFISDIHSLGLKMAQGLVITEAYYWDQNDRTRAFGKKFFERMRRMPTMNQAATYSATLHYLKAVKAAGTRDTKAVLAKMRETPVRDAFTDNGHLREDGRMVHSMLLLEVKKPEESKYPWDYYKILAEVPGDQVFRPLKDGGCPLVK